MTGPKRFLLLSGFLWLHAYSTANSGLKQHKLTMSRCPRIRSLGTGYLGSPVRVPRAGVKVSAGLFPRTPRRTLSRKAKLTGGRIYFLVTV